MIAVYNVSFCEPWQGVRMNGTFNRWVSNKEEAIKARANYELYYQVNYKDEYAKVELVSVS